MIAVGTNIPPKPRARAGVVHQFRLMQPATTGPALPTVQKIAFPALTWRGFYPPPAGLHWSLTGVSEQFENVDEETCREIETFVRLALKTNPTHSKVCTRLWSKPALRWRGNGVSCGKSFCRKSSAGSAPHNHSSPGSYTIGHSISRAGLIPWLQAYNQMLTSGIADSIGGRRPRRNLAHFLAEDEFGGRATRR